MRLLRTMETKFMTMTIDITGDFQCYKIVLYYKIYVILRRVKLLIHFWRTISTYNYIWGFLHFSHFLSLSVVIYSLKLKFNLNKSFDSIYRCWWLHMYYLFPYILLTVIKFQLIKHTTNSHRLWQGSTYAIKVAHP